MILLIYASNKNYMDDILLDNDVIITRTSILEIALLWGFLVIFNSTLALNWIIKSLLIIMSCEIPIIIYNSADFYLF